MTEPQVILIGGAPGVGKTTLGRALASKLDCASITIDDLMTVAQTVTTPDSHPGLHVMRRRPSVEYFTTSSIDELKADATMQHDASWTFVRELVVKHAVRVPSPMVIDGWHLRLATVARMDVPHVWSCWIVHRCRSSWRCHFRRRSLTQVDGTPLPHDQRSV